MYDDLAKLSGTGSEGLTLAQFSDVTMKHFVGTGDDFERMVRPTVLAMVDLCDTDNDGHLSSEEFKSWYAAIGVDPSLAEENFGRLDTDGSGTLSVDELVKSVWDYESGELEFSLLSR